ncbi:MAG TPA: YicC/YloC family endoribonuclease, partial [Acidobacteriaceae bacterium]|nr:YicC/YloC family endoribonuclease [Acidobacteriaceae bacterium]
VNESISWTLVLKAVNHRFLDLHMRMPAGSEALEMQLRRHLKSVILRGHLEVTLTIERALQHQVEMDHGLVAGYIEAFRAAATEHHLRETPSLQTILQLPGVFRTSAQGGSGNGSAEVRTAEMEQIEASVLAALPDAVAALQKMRAQEGAAMAADLAAIADRVLAAVDRVTELHGPMQAAHFERTSTRIAALLSGAADRERLLQEAAVLADRSDVSEELTRLRAHVEHFRQILAGGGELGKKLDFLLQEMNREANTMLSKTAGIAGAGTQVTEIGLGLKSEIEKAREQVQNLE